MATSTRSHADFVVCTSYIDTGRGFSDTTLFTLAWLPKAVSAPDFALTEPRRKGSGRTALSLKFGRTLRLRRSQSWKEFFATFTGETHVRLDSICSGPSVE